jgi:DNA-binding NtrC family response regulator
MASALKIIIVDDSEDDAEFIQEEVKKAGYELTATRVDSADALQSALAQGDWDLVLSDHSMPGFSASAALRVLEGSGLDIPFIIVSGAIGEELAVALMRLGAHDFIMKDRLGRLVPAIARELQEAQVRRDLKDAQVVQRTLLIRIQEDKEELERKVREMNALNQHFGQHVEVLEQAANTQQELIQGLTLLIEQASEIKAQVETLPISDMVAPFR